LEHLNRELAVFSRAVAFKNLSEAAAHVGVSQPQLSRIVSRLEAEMHVVLLDREARRKSGWTSQAYRVAEVYARTERQFERDILSLAADAVPSHVRVGTLDGLVPLASELCARLLAGCDVVTLLELHVYDLSELESLFSKGLVDLCFTSREPGRKKHRHVRRLGFQSLDWAASKDADLLVHSPFEHTTGLRPGRGKAAAARTVVSNSLVVREWWIRSKKGSGTIPSSVRSTGSLAAGDQRVLLIGQEQISPLLWERFAGA